MSGPYHTHRQAADSVRHITASPAGAWGDGCRRLLEDACRAAGVELGAYDYQVLLWLAGWEPWTVAVITGWIDRTHRPGLGQARAAVLPPAVPAVTLDPGQAATVLDALAFAAQCRRHRASLTCGACGQHPAELCEDHAADLDRADDYDATAAKLRETMTHHQALVILGVTPVLLAAGTAAWPLWAAWHLTPWLLAGPRSGVRPL